MTQAKTIIKNKFWIVEDNGVKVGTILSTDNGVVYVKDHIREEFNNIKLLELKHNVSFVDNKKTKHTGEKSIYGYPCDVTPWNSIYDVKNKLPLYTKNSSSKSYYCAGYYLIKSEIGWQVDFCPKRIIISRTQFIGPYSNKDQAISDLNRLA